MLVFVDIVLLGSLAWVVWLYFDFYIPKSLKSVKILQKYPFIIKGGALFYPKIKKFLCNRLHNSFFVSTFASDC